MVPQYLEERGLPHLVYFKEETETQAAMKAFGLLRARPGWPQRLPDVVFVQRNAIQPPASVIMPGRLVFGLLIPLLHPLGI